MKSLRLKRVSLSHDLKRASRSNHARIYTKTAQLYRVYHHRQRNKAITKKHVSLPFRGSFLEACNVCARRCVKSNRGRKGTKRKETKGNERKRSAADIHGEENDAPSTRQRARLLDIQSYPYVSLRSSLSLSPLVTEPVLPVSG